MSSARTILYKLGIAGYAYNPSRVVFYKRTYLHPETKQQVTLQPVPRFARRQFWGEACYGLHRRFDRVLFEDGNQPCLAPADPMRLLMQRAFPFAEHREYVSQDEMQQYVGAVEADNADYHVILTSLHQNLDPPVNPKARRGVERLLTVDPKYTVVMPWNVMHMPYLMWKLKDLGFEETTSAQVTLFTNTEAYMFAAFLTVFVFMPLYYAFTFTG